MNRSGRLRVAQSIHGIYADMRRVCADMSRVCAEYMRICARFVQDTRRIYEEYMGYTIGIGEGNGAVFKETYDRECYSGQ